MFCFASYKLEPIQFFTLQNAQRVSHYFAEQFYKIEPKTNIDLISSFQQRREFVTSFEQLWPEVGSVGAEQHQGTPRHPVPLFPSVEAAAEEEEEDEEKGDVPGDGMVGVVEVGRGEVMTAMLIRRVQTF